MGMGQRHGHGSRAWAWVLGMNGLADWMKGWTVGFAGWLGDWKDRCMSGGL